MSSTVPQQESALKAGAVLQHGRYILVERLACYRDDVAGMTETWWMGKDHLMICDIVMPSNFPVAEKMVYPAVKAYNAIGWSAYLPALLDFFSEDHHHCFVFAHPRGESLAVRQQRTGRRFTLEAMGQCCQQMMNVLNLLSKQKPPVIHGRISPQCIIATPEGWMLTGISMLSLVNAQSLRTMSREHLLAFTPPDFALSPVTWRTDLYGLAATMYGALTGSAPIRSGISQVPLLHPSLPSGWHTFFIHALHPDPQQRYLSLQEAFQAVEEAIGNPGEKDPSRVSMAHSVGRTTSSSPSGGTQVPQLLRSEGKTSDYQHLRPTSLLEPNVGHEMATALYWFGGLLLLAIAVIAFAR